MSVHSITAPASRVQNAIALASDKTGVDFDYLLGQAQVESGMRADARAPTSSATGLYQFIDQSWLGVVKQHGSKHGLSWAADSIRQTSGGRYTVSDPDVRRSILALRRDPQTAAMMAAEHAADNKTALEGSLGRAATGTDLYMAHFLGLGGARSFLGAMQASPNRTGAGMFPAAARANRNIFYASNGQPRTLSDIYRRFAGKLDRGAASVGATGLASDSLDATPPVLSKDPQMEVVLGNGAVDGDREWLASTLDRLGGGGNRFAGADATTGSALAANLPAGVSAYRPTPETARLAYLMLANLGAN